ncbi:hypothetical protein F5146DRAFT_767291 [Armillaria mellea]|nr:hypothetical protein F5146DRAFT_767291 [Armillaria mellea]
MGRAGCVNHDDDGSGLRTLNTPRSRCAGHSYHLLRPQGPPETSSGGDISSNGCTALSSMHRIGDERLVAKGIPSRKRLLDADPISVSRVMVAPSTKKRRKLQSSTYTPVISDADNLATALVPESTPLPPALPLTSSLQTTQPQLPDAESKYTTSNSPSPSRSPTPEQMRASFLRNAVRVPGKRRYRRRSSPSFFPPTMAVPERREDDEENDLYPADSYHLRPPYSDGHFYEHSPAVESSAEHRTAPHEDLFVSGTPSTFSGKRSNPPTAVSASPKVPSFSPSSPVKYWNSVNFGPTSLEIGKNMRKDNVSTPSSAGDESQRDESRF